MDIKIKILSFNVCLEQISGQERFDNVDNFIYIYGYASDKKYNITTLYSDIINNRQNSKGLNDLTTYLLTTKMDIYCLQELAINIGTYTNNYYQNIITTLRGEDYFKDFGYVCSGSGIENKDCGTFIKPFDELKPSNLDNKNKTYIYIY
jgi:hypothetical protein